MERDSYADLARKASARAAKMTETLTAEQGRSSELLKRVTAVLQSRDKSITDTSTQTSATINMCLQAIGVCEARVTGMTSELHRLRQEEQSNEVTVTTCAAIVESFEAYANVLANELSGMHLCCLHIIPSGTLFPTSHAWCRLRPTTGLRFQAWFCRFGRSCASAPSRHRPNG